MLSLWNDQQPIEMFEIFTTYILGYFQLKTTRKYGTTYESPTRIYEFLQEDLIVTAKATFGCPYLL